jgi:hypothetical protein
MRSHPLQRSIFATTPLFDLIATQPPLKPREWFDTDFFKNIKLQRPFAILQIASGSAME